MALPRLNLVVLWARDAERLAGFYTELGFVFELHRHGKGPEHFAAEHESGVFEIYPAQSETEVTQSVRLGFQVADVVQAVQRLTAKGGTLVSGPSVSPWGLRAVLTDLEAHKLEITMPDGALPE